MLIDYKVRQSFFSTIFNVRNKNDDSKDHQKISID